MNFTLESDPPPPFANAFSFLMTTHRHRGLPSERGTGEIFFPKFIVPFAILITKRLLKALLSPRNRETPSSIRSLWLLRSSVVSLFRNTILTRRWATLQRQTRTKNFTTGQGAHALANLKGISTGQELAPPFGRRSSLSR